MPDLIKAAEFAAQKRKCTGRQRRDAESELGRGIRDGTWDQRRAAGSGRDAGSVTDRERYEGRIELKTAAGSRAKTLCLYIGRRSWRQIGRQIKCTDLSCTRRSRKGCRESWKRFCGDPDGAEGRRKRDTTDIRIIICMLRKADSDMRGVRRPPRVQRERRSDGGICPIPRV